MENVTKTTIVSDTETPQETANRLNRKCFCGYAYCQHSALKNCPDPRTSGEFLYCEFSEAPLFDAHGNRVNPDGSLWNLDGKLAARNGND